MQKKEKIKIILTLAIILLLFSATYFFSPGEKLIKEVSPPVEEMKAPETNLLAQSEENAQTREAILEINGNLYRAPIAENTSVYDFMNKLRNDGKINFKDKTYIGLGKFIEEINGIRGNGSEFWIYYVNGKKAQVGVSNYKINPGDVVSWKYEKEI